MNKLGIEIFSKGLYSSWCMHRPTRSLFDCGEGLATYMGNFVYAIENVFISHQHGDHILGLPSLIGIRNSARGDKEKPLNVFYPADNDSIVDLINFIKSRNNRLSYELNFHPIEPGFKFHIDDKRYIRAFKMSHQKYKTTLGYVVGETRSRLKPEFVGQNIGELLKANPSLKGNLNVSYEANVFAYCLDSSAFTAMEIEGADHAVMDCTFLDSKDRDDMTHFTLDEAKAICKYAKVKNMIAAHVSPRYTNPQIEDVPFVVKGNRVLEI